MTRSRSGGRSTWSTTTSTRGRGSSRAGWTGLALGRRRPVLRVPAAAGNHGSFEQIDPPVVPRTAVTLGALTVGNAVRAADGYRYASAALSFTVPDVPSGRYAIGFCDDPCVHSTIGWLACVADDPPRREAASV
jgi:hypothetical protein